GGGGGFEGTIETDTAPPQVLRGARAAEPAFTPLLEIDAPTPVAAPAFRVSASPPLDGTLDGFELAEPLALESEDQYRRSEDAYPGTEEFSAAAYAAWDESALYLAVNVTKPDVILRPPDAAPLRLDNGPDGLRPHAGARVRFDLIINEMLRGRLRRAGQLVWSGGGGWAWLRGDRQDPTRFGILELVG